ncbi:MAG: tetratricopeptide repeat protein [Phycisphaerales bacterium]|nr:tetratricopeptide repeat protein [Phycisphaerales bacterium]
MSQIRKQSVGRLNLRFVVRRVVPSSILAISVIMVLVALSSPPSPSSSPSASPSSPSSLSIPSLQQKLINKLLATLDNPDESLVNKHDAQYQLGSIYHELGVLDEARFYFGDMETTYAEIAIDPSSSSYLVDDGAFMAGSIDSELGEVESALSRLNKFLIAFPESNLRDHAYFLVGDLYAKVENYDKAIASYDIVVSEFPESEFVVDSLIGIGKVHWAKLEYDKAAEILRTTIVDHIEDEDAVFAVITLNQVLVDDQIGGCCGSNCCNDFGTTPTIDHFAEIKENVSIANGLGNSGGMMQANLDFTRFVSFLARCRRFEVLPSQANELLIEPVELMNSTDPNSPLTKAAELERTRFVFVEDEQGAISAAKKIAKFGKTVQDFDLYFRAQDMLMQFYSSTGEFGPMADVANSTIAEELGPVETGKAHQQLGLALFHQGDLDGAHESFAKVIDNQSLDDDLRSAAMLYASQTLQAMNRSVEAKDIIQKLIADYPESSAASVAME